MRVLEATAGRRPTALDEAYQVFRLERQGNLVAPRTLEFYDRRVGELIAWLRSEAPTVERVEDVGVNHLRAFRAFMTERRRPDGQPLQAATLHASHRAIHTFLAWAELDGYGIDCRMLRLPPPRRPHKEATVFHVTQLRAILTACRPEETVRVLVGGPVCASASSLGSLCAAPTGSLLDSLERGRAELRVCWDVGWPPWSIWWQPSLLWCCVRERRPSGALTAMRTVWPAVFADTAGGRIPTMPRRRSRNYPSKRLLRHSQSRARRRPKSRRCLRSMPSSKAATW